MAALLMAPLSSQAAGLLLRLVAEGMDFRRDGEALFFRRPSHIPADVVSLIQAAKRALLGLLDDGVEARREIFAQQLAATASPCMPAFLFRRGIPYEPGRCFSCGDALPV